MKVKAILAIILAVMLVVFVLPAGVAAAPPTAHATGGGWIYDYLNSHKVSFGFTAQVDDNGNIDGELQAVDHEDKIVVHGSLTYAPLGGVDPVAGNGWLFGPCSVNGVDGYTLELSFWDSRENGPSNVDWVIIRVWDGPNAIYDWWNQLEGGNISVKKK